MTAPDKKPDKLSGRDGKPTHERATGDATELGTACAPARTL
jgi:hypothetical protein